MATKVHDHHQADDDDDDRDFAEIDTILARAKLELRRDRKLRRNINLSDIPENFAHVPSSCAQPASSDAVINALLESSSSVATLDPGHSTKPPAKLHVLGLTSTPMKWLRAYMSCLMAIPTTCDAPSATHHQHPPTSTPNEHHQQLRILASESSTTPRV